MPKKPMPEGKRFQPGKSGNPGGKVKIPDDIKEARKLNQNELDRTVNRLIYLSRQELRGLIENPETPMFEIMVASIIAQGAQKGDQMRLEFILNRIIGKVQDKLEVSVPKPFIVTKTNGEQVVLGAKPEKDEDE